MWFNAISIYCLSRLSIAVEMRTFLSSHLFQQTYLKQMKNTVITTIGFVKALLKRRLPFSFSSSSLSNIYNYLDIQGVYATSGQPDAKQFELIKKAGYELVINLAPTSVMENSLADEAELLKQLELDYVHLPVNFQRPRDVDFERFVNHLSENQSRKVWVHCAANMRVSAFTYRYRVAILKQSIEQAKIDLDKIWEPFGVWKKFVEKAHK